MCEHTQNAVILQKYRITEKINKNEYLKDVHWNGVGNTEL